MDYERFNIIIIYILKIILKDEQYEDIKNKKIDVIIIKDLSRLGRNYIETGNFVEVVFPAMGVSVISNGPTADECLTNMLENLYR